MGTVPSLLIRYGPVVLSLQCVGAVAVFFFVKDYNKNHQKSFEQSHSDMNKPSPTSLFELPAFRGKKNKNTPNPFQNTTWKLSLYERVKLSIAAVTILPMRLSLALASFFVPGVLVFILMKLGLKTLARLVISLGERGMLLSFGFIHIAVKGKQDKHAAVLVSNHATFLDGIAWDYFAKVRIFGEQANFTHPIMQQFAKAMDAVLFDRSGEESRREARKTMASSAADAYNGKASPILVFPTGTTTNSSVLITFKDGAFAPGLPVQPAIMKFQFSHCDPCWVFSGPGTLMLVLRLMSQVYNTVSLEYLPVHNPTEEEKKDPHLFARSVQLIMSKALGVPVTEHSLEDLQFQFAAVKANLPAEVGVVGFAGLKDVFSVDAKQIKQQMSVFKEMNPTGSGLIGFEEFKAAFTKGFHAPSDQQEQFLEEFFQQLTGGDDHLDFRKFLIGLALVNENEKAGATDEQANEGKEGESSGGRKESSPARMARSASSTTFPLAEIRGKIYAQLAFAAFASKSDNQIAWFEFKELWNWLFPDGACAELLAGLLSGGLDPKTDQQLLVRRVFEEIGGKEAEHLTWEQFSAYTERNPIFVTELRQQFFGRIATDLSAQ